jgi:two-component system chemotaxis sensor kinase CheA
MKHYPPDLLDVWPDDRGAAEPPGLRDADSLFAPFYALAQAELSWLARTVKDAKVQEEDVFDRLYRRGHVLAGMASLLRLGKAAHLLALLDLALDVARGLQTFERHSLAYVVDLLITTARAVLEELHATGRSERDLGEVVEECRTYLAGPLAQRLSPPPREQVPAPAQPVVVPVKEAPEPPAPVADGAFDDAPEELRIPADKAALTSDFCEEARESLAQVGHRLVALEEAAEPLPLVNELFRSIHTVKGGARLLKIHKMETLSHHLESLLDQIRKGARQVNAGLIDVLLHGKKLLEEMLDEVASRGPLRTRIAPCLAAIAALQSGQQPPALPAAPAAKPKPAEAVSAPVVRPAESIRIPTEKLDDVLNTASEVFISRIRLSSDVAAMNTAIRQFKHTLQRLDVFGPDALIARLAEANRQLVADLQTLVQSRRGRVSAENLEALVTRFQRELAAEAGQDSFSVSEELTLNVLSVEEIRKRLQKKVEHLEQLTSRLQTGAMSFRMVPVSVLFDRFPTQVRELARQMGKKVRLDVSGGDTELDKVLINQLADPLLHILRNSLDHGVEMPEARTAAGKPEAGQITLRAYYQGSHAVIEVRDDGRGIDPARILAKAIENGLTDAEKAAGLTRQQVFEFLFEPGFSTATQVSTVSGRGVGMDVVLTAISQVQGNVSVDSEVGRGTTIRMKLPLTLAVVGIVLVRERSYRFAFPIQHVEEILAVRLSEVRRVSGHVLYNYRGTTLPVRTLSGLLDFPPSPFSDTETSLVVLMEGERKVGVLVDAVLGRQEVLIKSLGSLIKKAPFVMGCTILSDSRLVLILNAWEIVHAPPGLLPPVIHAPTDGAQAERKEHTVLVVDDSTIQRGHLAAILTQAGYAVETADNGIEGLKRVRQRRYSACTVDVIMPLMDGFEFIERMRRLPGCLDVPVVVITGQKSQAERDRAVQLGAQDYFEKPVDPTRLVDALDRACLRETAASER